MGTIDYYEDGVDRPGFIHAFDGSTLKQVYKTDRPQIHKMKIWNGKRWAVASWDWNVPADRTSLLLSSVNGYDWSLEVEIPCPHIIGMECRPEGIYLSGGKKDAFGKVFLWRPK